MNSMFDLTGRVCLVTGGSRGIGYELARALSSCGAKVIITARKLEPLREAEHGLRAAGCNVDGYPHDLADHVAAPALVDSIVKTHGPIDILVNNAATGWAGNAADLPWERWQKVIDVNLNGTWALTQAVATQCMLPRRSGSIIFIASLSGLRPLPPSSTPMVAYNASKAAQINLAKSLASEWGANGIRVNAILPGFFPTRMARTEIEASGSDHLKRIPMGRFGELDRDMAGPIIFLASDASRYVTGHAMAVDGGMNAIL